MLFGLRKKGINGSFESLHLGTVIHICYVLDMILDTAGTEVIGPGHSCLGVGCLPMRVPWWHLRCWGLGWGSPLREAGAHLVEEAPVAGVRPAVEEVPGVWCCSQRCGTRDTGSVHPDQTQAHLSL